MIEDPLWFILASLFVIGSVIGSFLNVCIYRTPQHEKLGRQLRALWSPRSNCPGCHNEILFVDNIPVIGWLKLRGRCRFCKMRISPRYPLVELFNGLLFVAVYWFEVPGGILASLADSSVYSVRGPQGFGGLSPLALMHWRYAYHMVLLEALVVASFIDFDHKIIPDASTLPAMAVGVLGGWALGQVHLVPFWFQDPSLLRTLQIVLPENLQPLLSGSAVPGWIFRHPHLHGLLVSLIGLAAGGGIIWIVRIIGSWDLRQEAMGFGDVILMALIGSFLGWQPTVVVFFIAPVCALLVVSALWVIRRDREIPYGPYLSIATLILLLGWKQIWPVAERMFSTGPLVLVFAVFMAVMLAVSLLLMQFAKRLLGIQLYPEEWIEGWTSADQLTHFAGENVDAHQGRWRTEECHEWLGTSTGRGTAYEQQWRCGCLNGHPLANHSMQTHGRETQ